MEMLRMMREWYSTPAQPRLALVDFRPHTFPRHLIVLGPLPSCWRMSLQT